MAKVPAFLSRFKLNYNLLSLVLAAVIMLEGIIIAVTAKQVDMIESMGAGLSQGTVALIGLQLFAIGLLAFLCMVANGEYLNKIDVVSRLRGKLFRDRAFLFPVFALVPLVIGGLVAVEGLVAAYYASPMVVRGTGDVRTMWPAVFGAQLFLVGIGLIVARLFEGRLDLPVLVRASVLALFASFGVFMYGLAAKASVTGIGAIQGSTVEFLGIQMAAVAIAALALMRLGDRAVLGRRFFGWKIGTLGIIALSMVLCLEGMVLASVAAPFSLDSVGGMQERTMLLTGIGLAILAMVVPASYFLLEKKDLNLRKLGYAATLFLCFLLPFSVLM
ncbi:MAG: hypothetical protein SA339_03810 [Methanomassiliicoccus sp.]|nr:hypothetical protein [Methanomassiliicoccus sp.]